MLWSVLPEALLHQADYQLWEAEVGHTADGFRPLGNEEFNELSQQAWTHLLMQVVKVQCSYILYMYMYVNTCTVEPLNKGHLGTRASVLYSEVSFIRRLEMY